MFAFVSRLTQRRSPRKARSQLARSFDPLRIEFLEVRRLLALTVGWNSTTQALSIAGSAAAEDIVVSTEYVSDVAFPRIEDLSTSTVWRGSTNSPQVTAASIKSLSVHLKEGDDRLDLSAVAPSSGFTGFVGSLPIQVIAGSDNGAGNDTIYGSQLADQIQAGLGSDLVDGQGGNDLIFGGTGSGTTADALLGGEGDDEIYGATHVGATSRIDGGGGNDMLAGGPGGDAIFGGLGADRLYGNGGDDGLHGGPDNDTIDGGASNDNLFGDTGDDSLLGGAGNDNFVFRYYLNDVDVRLQRTTAGAIIAQDVDLDLGTDTIVEFDDEGDDALDYSDFRGAYSTPTLPANVELLIAPPASSAAAIGALNVDLTSTPGSALLKVIGGQAEEIDFYLDTNNNGVLDSGDTLLGTISGEAVGGQPSLGNVGQELTVSTATLPRGRLTFFARAADGSDPGNEPDGPPTAHSVKVNPDAPISLNAYFNRVDQGFNNPYVHRTIKGNVNAGSAAAAPGSAGVIGPVVSTLSHTDFSTVGGATSTASDSNALGSADAFGHSNINGIATSGDVDEAGFNVAGLLQLAAHANAMDNEDADVLAAGAGGNANGSLRNLRITQFDDSLIWELTPWDTDLPTPDQIDVLFDFQGLITAILNSAGVGVAGAAGLLEFDAYIGSQRIISASLFLDAQGVNGNIRIGYGPLYEFELPGLSGSIAARIIIPMEIGERVRVEYQLNGLVNANAVGNQANVVPFGNASAMSGGLYSFIATIVGWRSDEQNNIPAVTAEVAAPTGIGPFFRGEEVNLQLEATDADAADMAEDFVYEVDWDGDGTVDTTVTGPASGVNLTHAFAASGKYNIRATATDQNGGVSTVAVVPVEVETIVARTNGSNTSLYWGGSPGFDAVYFVNSNQNVSVFQQFDNGVLVNKYNSFTGINGRIRAYGYGGDDTISAELVYTRRVEFYGGDGNDGLYGGENGDTLDGGAGDDLLIGAVGSVDGNDRLFGQDGRDVLIGHLGADTLDGGAGEDLLLTGQHNFGDEFYSTATGTQAIWRDPGLSYQDRVDSLAFDTMLPDDLILDDGVVDRVIGGTDLDWFLYTFGQDLADDPISPEVETDLLP